MDNDTQQQTIGDDSATNDAADSITEIEPDHFRKDDDANGIIIEYRRDICIGAGTCAAIAPYTFEMDDENKAVFVREADAEDDLDTIIASAQSCPVFAITIKDKATGEQLFPIE